MVIILLFVGDHPFYIIHTNYVCHFTKKIDGNQDTK